MNFADYQKLAIRTLAPADKAIERFTMRQENLLLDNTEDIQYAAERLDAFKRIVFYGKEPETPDTTLLPDASSRLSEREMNAIHAAVGLLTETAELSEAVIAKTINDGTIDEKNVFEELGDIMWYIAVLTNTLGIDLEKVMKANIDKLAARYGDKFDDYRAVNRNLEAEAEALSQIPTDHPTRDI